MVKVPNYKQQTPREIYSQVRKGSYFRQWKKARYENQGGRCFYCLSHIQYKGSECDHVIPLHRGGTNSLNNLVITCKKCNQDKGIKVYSDEEIYDFRQKLYAAVKEDLSRVEQEDKYYRDVLSNL